jgi:hypothetical protein
MKTLSKLTLTLCLILSSFCFQLQKSYAYCTTGLYANMCSTPGNTFISNVSLVGKNLSNSSGCTGITGPGVNVYLATGNYTDTLQQGLTYTLSITTAQSSVIVYWIDFNQNNLFDAYPNSRALLRQVLRMLQVSAILLFRIPVLERFQFESE